MKIHVINTYFYIFPFLAEEYADDEDSENVSDFTLCSHSMSACWKWLFQFGLNSLWYTLISVGICDWE